ncbi:hypothetical protein BGX27_008062 [Mortierella sp. AM989]|nr:hypothetical protein BGX27_008062 [Mortierella sp. AM989]
MLVRNIAQVFSKKVIIVTVITLFVGVTLLEFYSLKETPQPSSPQLPATHLHENTDRAVKRNPHHDVNHCNNLPNIRHLRGLQISRAAKEKPIKIFHWEQTTWSGQVDWKKESLTLCPIPLDLQPFFDRYRIARIGDPTIKWETGYAPCYFWRPADRTGSCNTKAYGNLDFVVTSNYSDFIDADVIYMNNLIILRTQEPPYYDSQLLPPKTNQQRWVSFFEGESVAYFPHVAMPEFIRRFDLTMGSPPQLMDVPYSPYRVSNEMIRELVNVAPSFPLDKTPEDYMGFLVSNCSPLNDRNKIMDELVDKIGAHSYGICYRNKEFPEGIEKNGLNWEEDKKKVLSKYPFSLAAENSNCVGYVTEKIYDVLAMGSIPVYMGASDIADYVPEGSYILAQDFKSTEALVEYIKTVDRSQFYKWKEVVKKDPSQFCKRCMDTNNDYACSILNNVNFIE